MRVVIKIDSGDEKPAIVMNSGSTSQEPTAAQGTSAGSVAAGPGPSAAPSADLLTRAQTVGALDGGPAPSAPPSDAAPPPFTGAPPSAGFADGGVPADGHLAGLAVDISAGPAPTESGTDDYVTTVSGSVTAEDGVDKPDPPEAKPAGKKPDHRAKK